MGYVTDDLALLPATELTPAATPGALVTGPTFAGSDYARGLLQVDVSAVSSPTITDWGVFLQSEDASGNWYPALAQRADAVGYEQLGTSAPSAGELLETEVSSYPGDNFRVAVYAVGTAGNITVAVNGELQKVVPDNT
jgi:hypothetical protein